MGYKENDKEKCGIRGRAELAAGRVKTPIKSHKDRKRRVGE
jgi:hypothetical protein